MARITVEDCLIHENNRFALVLLASKRAKQILGGSTLLADSRGNKEIVSALREIAVSKVRFMTVEEQRLAVEKEIEQAALDAAAAEVGTNGHSNRSGLESSSETELSSSKTDTSAADLLFGVKPDDSDGDDGDEDDEAKVAKKASKDSSGSEEE